MHRQNSKPVRAKRGQIEQGSPRCKGPGRGRTLAGGVRSMDFETHRGRCPHAEKTRFSGPAHPTSRKLPDFSRPTREDTSRKTGGPLFQNTLRHSRSETAPQRIPYFQKMHDEKGAPLFTGRRGSSRVPPIVYPKKLHPVIRSRSPRRFTHTKNSPTLSADAGRGRRRGSPAAPRNAGRARSGFTE